MSTQGDWDYENAEVHEPEREVMSVYSLRFTSKEIADIREAARREGREHQRVHPNGRSPAGNDTGIAGSAGRCVGSRSRGDL